MKLVDLRCPACGGTIERKTASNVVVCEYCESRYFFDDEEADALQEDVFEEECEEASSLSMADYAEQACASFLESFDNGSFRETPKIVRGLGIEDGEVIFLIHDDTFMKSGKNGFAITDRGLHCRDMGEAATFTDWASFAKLDAPAEDGCYIRCDGKSVCYYTDDSDLLPELMKLYKRLHRYALRHA